MTEVARWLEELGIAQYAQAFADNDIDLEVLPHLNEQDLEKLGISLGHRKKLLHAIALLADAPATTGTSDAAEGSAPRPSGGS